MELKVLRVCRCRGIANVRSAPGDFDIFTRQWLSKYTLTSDKWDMKTMDDARNLVKSNGGGMGDGSRSVIAKDVH